MTHDKLDSGTEPHVAVDCYVRTDAVSDPIEADVESLRALTRDGRIDEFTVRTWPGEVVLSPLTEESLPVERYQTFQQWAAQWGVRIEPPFQRETRRSVYTGETREVLTTPALCLAVRVDGRLREVFPHSSKGTTHTITDAIETLKRGVPTGEEMPPEAPRSERCPDCAVSLASGQGLYACPECEWVGMATGHGTYRRFESGESAAESTDEKQRLIP